MRPFELYRSSLKFFAFSFEDFAQQNPFRDETFGSAAGGGARDDCKALAKLGGEPPNKRRKRTNDPAKIFSLTGVRVRNYNETMNKILKVVFYAILLFFVYHLIRDLLTNVGFHNYILDFAHRPKTLWCGRICPWVTVPPEIIAIIASIVVLKRNYSGTLGVLVLLQVPIWIMFIALVP